MCHESWMLLRQANPMISPPFAPMVALESLQRHTHCYPRKSLLLSSPHEANFSRLTKNEAAKTVGNYDK